MGNAPGADQIVPARTVVPYGADRTRAGPDRTGAGPEPSPSGPAFRRKTP
ncbi:hypothetical protein ACFXCZ_16040 [Streptomyces sp. NPDC059396]